VAGDRKKIRIRRKAPRVANASWNNASANERARLQEATATLFQREHGLCARHALQSRITFRPMTLPRP
jgi:hypothetical protein